MTAADPKSSMRERARARRKEAARLAGPTAARQLADHGMGMLRQLTLPAQPVIAGYWPVGSEMDVRALLERIVSKGMRVALPVVQSQSTPLTFRAWDPSVALVDGPLGTQQPGADQSTLTPDVVLTPLLAFDDTGHRLGQGGGYYDRTLAALRAGRRVVALGIAFDGQRVSAVSREQHDQRLDGIVTEVGAMQFG